MEARDAGCGRTPATTTSGRRLEISAGSGRVHLRALRARGDGKVAGGARPDQRAAGGRCAVALGAHTAQGQGSGRPAADHRERDVERGASQSACAVSGRGSPAGARAASDGGFGAPLAINVVVAEVIVARGGGSAALSAVPGLGRTWRGALSGCWPLPCGIFGGHVEFGARSTSARSALSSTRSALSSSAAAT